ncbi:unnamed protein product [Hymenolepis diminuta]|uniref:Ovule protein n=1 Tax=Hymenolepis diminuta TaxID=6216 RepID=A0A0R3SRS1_HYMDI|nr:unnamed protein product [Hymenolepis diminuta]
MLIELANFDVDDDDEKHGYFEFEEMLTREEKKDSGKLILKPAAFSSVGENRKAIWRGTSSYPGFKRYDKNNQAKKVTSMSQTYTTSPSAKIERTRINVPLHNKQRVNDKEYLEGLQDLADLS